LRGRGGEQCSVLSADTLSAQEKEAQANLVTSLVGVTTLATGREAIGAMVAARTETENNYLAPSEVKQMIGELVQCRVEPDGAACLTQVKEKFEQLSTPPLIRVHWPSTAAYSRCKRIMANGMHGLCEALRPNQLANVGSSSLNLFSLGTQESFLILFIIRGFVILGSGLFFINALPTPCVFLNIFSYLFIIFFVRATSKR